MLIASINSSALLYPISLLGFKTDYDYVTVSFCRRVTLKRGNNRAVHESTRDLAILGSREIRNRKSSNLVKGIRSETEKLGKSVLRKGENDRRTKTRPDLALLAQGGKQAILLEISDDYTIDFKSKKDNAEKHKMNQKRKFLTFQSQF